MAVNVDSWSWTDGAKRTEGYIEANNIELNAWACRSAEVLERWRNVRPHDPDGRDLEVQP